MENLKHDDVLSFVLTLMPRCEKIVDELVSSYTVTMKRDQSLLTDVDLAIDSYLCQTLKQKFSEIPIISEETPIKVNWEDRKKWNQFFLIDPLDGTKEFVAGNAQYTINIALIDKGEPVVGVIYAPELDLCYYAQKNRGAWKIADSGKPEKLRRKPWSNELRARILLSRSHQVESKNLADFLAGFHEVDLLRVGSSLKFCWLAENKADLYYRGIPCMEWDVAAGDCILSEALDTGSVGRALPFQYNQESLTIAPFLIGGVKGEFLKIEN
jgi:3'(2'), 5'-bisphosphate nucleotidase